MTQDFRLLFWFVVAVALVIAGIWATWRLVTGSGRKSEVVAVAAEPRAVELLHVEQDPATRRLVLWVRGRRVESVDAVEDAELRAALQLLLSSLSGQAASIAREIPPAPLPRVAPTAAPPVALSDDDLKKPFFARVRESLAKPQDYAPSPYASKPKGKPPQQTAEEAPQATGMFAEINAILQRKLREHPDVTPLEILGEQSELHIRMGDLIFTHVDDVPDERAKELIRSAVAEWEKS